MFIFFFEHSLYTAHRDRTLDRKKEERNGMGGDILSHARERPGIVRSGIRSSCCHVPFRRQDVEIPVSDRR